MCSTPYGINGLGSLAIAMISTSSTCAQRLTASMVWAVLEKHRILHCLTVLNALRHQWFGQ